MPNYIRTKQIDQTDLSGFFIDTIGSQSGLLLEYISGVTLNETVLLTGNQNVSGIKTFVDGVNLNNIDNLNLSGVDISITNGNITITNSNLAENSANLIVQGSGTFFKGIKIGDGGLNAVISIYDGPNDDYNKISWNDSNLTFNNYPSVNNQYLNYDFSNDPYSATQTIAVDSKVVHNTSNETISGIKTFVSRPTVNGTGVLLIGEGGGGGGVENVVYTTGNQTISGVKTFANGSNQILNTTYSSLTGLKAISGLLSGQLYRISDFVLKWNNQSINDQTVKTAASGEPLIVTALSKDRISHIAQSETYPQDTIYYNIDASGSYSWGGINNNSTIPNFKGWIYRRIDNVLNIDIPYDWRNITVNCCKVDVSSVPNYSGNYNYNRLAYVKETGNNSNRGKLYYSVVTGNSGNGLNNPNFWSPISDYVESGTYFATREDANFTALYAYDGDAEEDVPIINLPFIPSSRIQQPVFTSTFTGLGIFKLSNVHNIKINGGHNSVFLGESVYNNNIGDNFYSNTIGQNTYSNNIGDNFYQNILSDGNAFNDIGDNCFQNIAMGNFSYNKIDHNFYYNTIGSSFYSNNIKSFFDTNIIAFNFNYNSIDQFFYANLIASNFYLNTIGKNFTNNAVANSFNSNTVGNDFIDNTIKNNFQYNAVANSFRGNTVGNDFNGNIIENSFNSNTVGNDFNTNTVGNFFESNTIGNYFNGNTIGNYFNSNTVVNNFFGNTCENNFNSVNFTSSTHVYNNYNTTLFQNSAHYMRLRYFNSSDQLVVTDPTA
jgi:hypothetical protein